MNYDYHVRMWANINSDEECYLQNTLGPITRVWAYIQWRSKK